MKQPLALREALRIFRLTLIIKLAFLGLGLGTLNVQTAGMSGQTGAEENLVGLANVQEVYEMVVTELRRFRGGMAPTAAEVEGEPIALPSNALNAILAEVRTIRQSLQTD